MPQSDLTPTRFTRTYTVSSGLASGGIADVGIASNGDDKFGPFKLVNVVNPSGQMIAVMPNGNQSQQLVCGDNYDKVWSDLNFTGLTIKNLDGADATDADIYVTVQTDLSNRELIEHLARIVRRG